METITFTLGGHKKMVYESTLTEGQLLYHYLAEIKEQHLPNLLQYDKGIEVPNYLVGAYKAKGYKVEEYSKGCGTYRVDVVPELVFQVVKEREEISWERIE